MGRYEERLVIFGVLMAFDTLSARRLAFGPSTIPSLAAASQVFELDEMPDGAKIQDALQDMTGQLNPAARKGSTV